jgi:hypothetical protein
MRTTKESGFEGPLPSSIKPDGFHCYRRGGCDTKLLCEREGGCLGADLPLTVALNRNRFDEIAEIQRLDADPPSANGLSRNRIDEFAERVRSLTYGELIEFAGDLWRLRGKGKLNGETLPKILHAWATKTELPPDCAVQIEPALPAGECNCEAGKKFQPIGTAPKDRPILAFMLGQWRITQWKLNHPHRRPIPFWSANDLRVTVSRAHQPEWWAELPASPPEAEA